MDWTVTLTRWKKILGYGTFVDDEANTVTLSCIPVIEQLVHQHCGSEHVIQPKHPYPMGMTSVGPGVRPPDGSLERADFDAMQTKCRSMLGVLIWVSRVHRQVVFPTNFNCGFMSNPSHEVYKNVKYAAMFELANPSPIVFGGGAKRGLVMRDTFTYPFAEPDPHKREMCLHAFVDASLGSPPKGASDDVAIADGASKGNPLSMARSMTGGKIMVGGAVVEDVAVRQHLVAPDVHVSEITAACAIAHKMIPIKGVLCELLVPQERAPYLFGDSSSVLFVANDSASVHRSVWVQRKAIVLRELKDIDEINFLKICEFDNISDGNTKPIRREAFLHHLWYTNAHC